MKKLLVVLMVLGFGVAFSIAQIKEPDGFLGMKWVSEVLGEQI